MSRYYMKWANKEHIYETNIIKQWWFPWKKALDRFAKNNGMENDLDFTILEIRKLY